MRPQIEKGFYYLHAEGDLIYKPITVVDSDPDYFKSSFVKKFWKMNFSYRVDAWQVVLEALALGCKVERARELAGKWGLTYDDSFELIRRCRPGQITELMRDGLEIFVKEILGMEPGAYWGKLKEDWDVKMDAGRKEGKAQGTD